MSVFFTSFRWYLLTEAQKDGTLSLHGTQYTVVAGEIWTYELMIASLAPIYHHHMASSVPRYSVAVPVMITSQVKCHMNTYLFQQ